MDVLSHLFPERVILREGGMWGRGGGRGVPGRGGWGGCHEVNTCSKYMVTYLSFSHLWMYCIYL